MHNLLINEIPESEISLPYDRIAIVVILKSKLYHWACNVRSVFYANNAVHLIPLSILMSRIFLYSLWMKTDEMKREMEIDKNEFNQGIILMWIFMIGLGKCTINYRIRKFYWFCYI